MPVWHKISRNNNNYAHNCLWVKLLCKTEFLCSLKNACEVKFCTVCLSISQILMPFTVPPKMYSLQQMLVSSQQAKACLCILRLLLYISFNDFRRLRNWFMVDCNKEACVVI